MRAAGDHRCLAGSTAGECAGAQLGVGVLGTDASLLSVQGSRELLGKGRSGGSADCIWQASEVGAGVDNLGAIWRLGGLAGLQKLLKGWAGSVIGSHWWCHSSWARRELAFCLVQAGWTQSLQAVCGKCNVLSQA